MSRKRIRKLLSTALGLVALGGSSGVFAREDGVTKQQELAIDEEEVETYNGKEEEDFDSSDVMMLEDDINDNVREEVRLTVDDYRETVRSASEAFLNITNKWDAIVTQSGIRATLKKNADNINALIKVGTDRKNDFDNATNVVTGLLPRTTGREKLFSNIDAMGEACKAFTTVVDQLERAVTDYEKSLASVAAVDEKADINKRKANASLINSERSSVGEYLKKVRSDFKDFTDVKGRKELVEAFSNELSDMRRQVDSKGGDGLGDTEYESMLARLKEIRTELGEIARTLKEDKESYKKETNHSLLTKMRLQIGKMWKQFSIDCNPRRLSAVGMGRDSVDQGNRFYQMVKSHYVKLCKEVEERIDKSIDRVSDALDPEVRSFYDEEIAKLNSRIVSCRRAFLAVQEYEAGRQPQLSPAEYRQKARAEFVSECRRIRDRDELTQAEKLDELVAAMSKILPGRESFHRQILDVLSRDVQIDPRGNVDSTSVLSKNILFIGAPGNGKTEESLAAADALGLKVIYANGDNFATEASSNAFYNNLVNETLNANSRFVIFFDEIDSIFTNRALIGGGDQKGAVTVFNNFVTRMQRSPELMKKYAGTMATTNLAPDALDTALVSRFQRQLHVPKFDESDARQFLRVELEPVSLAANTTKEALIGTLATIMTSRGMDARSALNVIDEVYSYSKSLSTEVLKGLKASDSVDDELDVSSDVIVMPGDLVAGFNGMKLGGSKGRGNALGGAETRPSTPLRS